MIRGRLTRLLSSAARRAGYELSPRRKTMAIDSRFGLDILGPYVEKLVQSKSPEAIFLLQIGANDGVHEDPVRELINKHNIRAALCEPLSGPYKILERNYKNISRVTCLNCAVGAEDGCLLIYTLDPTEQIENTTVISSSQRSLVERWCRNWNISSDKIREEHVPQKTIRTIIANLGQKYVDIAVVDTEGMDAIICNQLLDLDEPPLLLQFEYNNCPLEEMALLLKRLETMGYRFARSGLDIVAARGHLAL